MFDLTLTFDNGPDPETTPFVLDVLARRSLRTTFFVVGHKLSTLEGRRLARRAHEEGHWIGNHTWSHSVPLGLLEDPSAISEEIRGTQEVIGALAHPHRFFRPFGQGGNLDERLLNPTVVDVLTAERMSCVLHDDFPSPLHWRLFPRDAHDGSIMVHGVVRIAGGRCLQLDDQLICLDFDANDVVADEVSVSTFCAIFEMFAHGRVDQSFDLGRGHPS